MIVGDEEQTVEAGSLVFIPPDTPHAMRNGDDEMRIYVSASSPPFPVDVRDQEWSPGERGPPT